MLTELWINFIKYERSNGDFEYANKIYKNSLIFMKPEFRNDLMHAKDQLDITSRYINTLHVVSIH